MIVAGGLLILSILASKVAERSGVPVLLFFLVVGMLAGSEGPGGIYFDDTTAANLLGTIALAFILFSGGFDTHEPSVKPVLGRGLLLATLGVAVTALLVGLFAWAALSMPLLEGLLLGAIVSSTDAAAVFGVLRSRGVSLKGRLRPLLELESGSNDPMAVFLTISLLRMLTVPGSTWAAQVPFFVLNMGVGLAVGAAAGRLSVPMFNRFKLHYEGLYPVLSLSLVLLTFGASELLRGNGFLAVYVCGIMLGNADFAHKRSLAKFHDGLGWLMQISMFLVLGLLVFPSRLVPVAGRAMLVSLFLILVARPAAVHLGLWRSSFSLRERALVAWTGLRGAVPIVLATFPFTVGYARAGEIFDTIFFIVLTSVLLQGRPLMAVARWLKVDAPLRRRRKYPLEYEKTPRAQGETREIDILPGTRADGRRVSDLPLPRGVLILLVGRGESFLVPKGDTRIEAHDTLLVLGSPADVRAAQVLLESCEPEAPPDEEGDGDPEPGT